MADKVQIVIEVDGRQGTAAIAQVKSGLASLGPAASAGIGQLSSGVSKLQSQFTGLGLSMKGALGALGLTFGASAAIGFFNDAIAASNQLRQSSLGLGAVARNLGVDMNAAKAASQALTQDGFLNLADSSRGLQNLLASGLNLPFATALMNKNKDAAIFNRQSHLGLSESIKVFTDGFKNELSTLTDATGVSTNYSRALDDTFKLIKAGQLDFSKYRDLLSDTEIATVKQAVASVKAGEQLDKHNKSVVAGIGFLRELELFQGNAAKAADDLTIAQQKLDNEWLVAKGAVGDALNPAMRDMITIASSLLPLVRDLTVAFADLFKAGPNEDTEGSFNPLRGLRGIGLFMETMNANRNQLGEVQQTSNIRQQIAGRFAKQFGQERLDAILNQNLSPEQLILKLAGELFNSEGERGTRAAAAAGSPQDFYALVTRGQGGKTKAPPTPESLAAAKKFAADRRFFKGELLEGWAHLMKSQAQIEDQGSKLISKSIQDDIESGLKTSNDRILDDFKRRKEAEKAIAQLGFESSLALATTEEERTRLQNERELADFAAKYAGIDGLAQASDAYRAALEEASAAKSAARNRDRLQSLQDELALLQAEIGGGVGGGAGARFNRQLSRLGIQQGIDRRQAKSPEELAILSEVHHAQVIKLQQDRYTDLYNNVADHAGRVWDGMFQKGKNVFTALGETIKGIWLTTMRKMFSDFVAGLLTPIFSRLSGGFGGSSPLGQGGTSGGLLGLGGIFGGGGLGGFRTPPFLPGGAAAGSLAGVAPTIAKDAFGNLSLGAGGAGGAGAAAGGGGASFFGLSGAQLGAFFTNPFTIAAGIGIAATIAFIKLRKNRQDKFRDEILRDFAIAVEDKRLLGQIKRIGEGAFGGNADKKRHETLRLDPVQGLLLNYAQQTGQSPALLPLYQRFYGKGLAADNARMNIAKFAHGGVVPGIDRGYDSVLSLLRPGETVTPKSQFAPAAAAPTVSITLNVNTDANGFRAVLPQLKRELTQAVAGGLKRDYGRTDFRQALLGI